MRRTDALETLERLEPALHLPCLARLGPEARDELHHVGHLALLARVHRLLQRESRRTLGLVRRVVARVERQPRALDAGDVRHATIEKVAIVRDDQQRAAEAAEPALEPDDRVEVEVVGRLVEQQQVGPARQRASEVEAHAPAAGELGDAALEVGVFEPESREQARGAGLGAVAVERRVALVQLAEARAIVRAFGVGERLLDRTQLVVTVEHEVERAAVERRGLLCDRGDAPMRGHGAGAALADELAAEQGKETGLAAAVRRRPVRYASPHAAAARRPRAAVERRARA